jgi:hypothetical protein
MDLDFLFRWKIARTNGAAQNRIEPMMVELVSLPHFPGWESSESIFAVRKSADVWFEIGKNMSPRDVSKQSSCCVNWRILSYFQSILFLIWLNVWPQISQLNGIPLETAFGVGGTLRPPPSSPAEETNEVCDAEVTA